MIVTKQQQLEWLAKAYKTWPEQGSHSLRLSAFEVGKFAIVNCYVITRKEWQQERDKMQKQADNRLLGDNEYCSGYNQAIRDCEKQITSAGYKVE